jgi:hypothetical protein
MIMIDFHNLAKATAGVFQIQPEGRWFATVNAEDETGQVTFYTGNHKHKVEAIMAAFELVDTLKAACQKLADDEGMRDLEDSVEEKSLIDGGTEAIPEPEYTSKPLTGEATVRAS